MFLKSKQRSQNVLCLMVKDIPTFLFYQLCEMLEIGSRHNSCCKKKNITNLPETAKPIKKIE